MHMHDELRKCLVQAEEHVYNAVGVYDEGYIFFAVLRHEPPCPPGATSA